MDDSPIRIDRRQAIKWVVAATATVSLIEGRGFGAAATAAKGYGTDPNLMEVYKPGDLWKLTFTPAQRRIAAALCDVIIPEDEKSPSASHLYVHDFIGEWISAPYPKQQADRKDVLELLIWIEAESTKRFKKGFLDLSEAQKNQICDDISFLPKATPRFKQAAQCFARYRDLTAGGFYTTPEGMKDVG